MKAYIWNLRGFGNEDRKRQLREFMIKKGVDILGYRKL
jgi:hypothetical protein